LVGFDFTLAKVNEPAIRVFVFGVMNVSVATVTDNFGVIDWDNGSFFWSPDSNRAVMESRVSG
jgi:hypothetical protein